MRPDMNIRKIATITALVLSSLAATDVAPTKAELEAMYDKAYREFNATNYAQALKELDSIDARQPDLAESQNLRGVILMRQASYDQAETALQKALAADPKFWNARFNLAEIPFLRKDWTEARKRFDGLLQGNSAELQGEAAQLIQYKILLTYLLQGNENMVDSILAKFELAPETPAANYANAAIAFHHKNEKEAKDILATAEKNFSPQLNKLFAESLYEVGWLQKPAGQARAAIELTSPEDQLAKAKALATEKYEQAERAFQQRDLTAARRLVDEADAADPNQAATVNLRGEILLAQKDLAGAEAAFRQAAKLDPKMAEAQYNLALIPFQKKEYSKARDAFEALFGATSAPGGGKNQTGQIIKFNIYLTLLLEGKDARAQKMMEQFKFTGDTPALYYAQAAWEFKHNNAAKANDWIVSARKIYSPALNFVFANSFYDLGWLQNQSTTSTASSTEVAKAEAPPSESGQGSAAVENSTKPSEQVSEIAAQNQPGGVSGAESIGANGSASDVAKNETGVTAPALPPKVESVASNPVAAETGTTLSQQTEHRVPAGPAPGSQQNTANNTASKVAAVAAANGKPAGALAKPAIQGRPQPAAGDQIGRASNSRTLLVGILLLAGLLLLAWVVVSELRRRVSVTAYQPPAPAMGPRFSGMEPEMTEKKITPASRLAGGPPQISVQLKASEPSVRRAAVPFGKMNRPFGVGAVGATGNGSASENAPSREVAPVQEPERISEPEPQFPMEVPPMHTAERDFDYVGEVTSTPTVEVSEVASSPDWEFTPIRSETASAPEGAMPGPINETPISTEASTLFDAPVTFDSPASVESVGEPVTIETSEFFESVGEPMPIQSEFVQESFAAPPPEIFGTEMEPVAQGQPIPYQVPPLPTEFASPPEFFETVSEPISQTADEAITETAGEPIFEPVSETVSEPITVPEEMIAQSTFAPAAEISEMLTESVAQDQAIPYQSPSFSTDPDLPMTEVMSAEQEVYAAEPQAEAVVEATGLSESIEPPSFVPQIISIEPLAQQTTIQATMPETTQPTIAPTIRTSPMTGGIPQPQPASGMHTAVQLTFSFEIASMQLSPSFKMGALQLKPTSKVVTMRLAPSQQPQPAMNLQVTFEIASVQLAGNAIGMIRLTPSQQQRPGVISSPAFSVAGLQLLAGADTGAVQITPSQQGQASVHVTGRFQIATVEFSPSFEIASIVLNSTSKNVSVQLPGAGPSAVEGAPVFEVSNVQLAGNGEIAIMQLIAQGAAPKAA